MNNIYDVLDVSRYVINLCHDKNLYINNSKLQKLLYFVQAYFLVIENRPCFREKIIAWQFGPVIEEVYDEFKYHGPYIIPRITHLEEYGDNMLDYKEIEYSSNMITAMDKKIIEKVINDIGDYENNYLIELTSHQLPWMNAYKTGERNIINNNVIREYFK